MDPNIPEYINLRIVGEGNSILHVKIKTRSQIKGILRIYCQRHRFTAHKLRFRYHGNPIMGTETPLELEMKDGDYIEVTTVETSQD